MSDAAFQDLFQAAKQAYDRSYSPYSRFPVGAAIRTPDGRIFAGTNVENAAYPSSQCAEASAIGVMVVAGVTRIAEILVLGGATATASCVRRAVGAASVFASLPRRRRRSMSADRRACVCRPPWKRCCRIRSDPTT